MATVGGVAPIKATTTATIMFPRNAMSKARPVNTKETTPKNALLWSKDLSARMWIMPVYGCMGSAGDMLSNSSRRYRPESGTRPC